MIEPLMAVPAYLAASAAQVLLVPGLALAAETMIYVVSDEIIKL